MSRNKTTLKAGRDAWQILRDNYTDFVKKIAPHLGNGFVSQDENGTDFTEQEPELRRHTGENRDKFTWIIERRSIALPNVISVLFPNVPVHPDPENTLFEIKDGQARQIVF